MPVESYRPEDRVKRRSDFRAVQSGGRKVHTPHFLVVVAPREGSLRTRLGITVTKKVSSSAVGRNRVKRVVREVFRRNRELFPDGCDVVVIAKREAPSLGYGEVLEEMRAASRAMKRRGGRP